jgi:hypothetical protein
VVINVAMLSIIVGKDLRIQDVVSRIYCYVEAILKRAPKHSIVLSGALDALSFQHLLGWLKIMTQL